MSNIFSLAKLIIASDIILSEMKDKYSKLSTSQKIKLIKELDRLEKRRGVCEK